MGVDSIGTGARFALRGRHMALVVMLAAIVFCTLFVYADLADLFHSLGNFPPRYIAIVLALALANYLIRLIRWTYYLRTLGVDIRAPHNVLIFFSGLSMAISPAKVGELAKCYLLSEADGVPVSRSSPAVIMERLTDMLAVFALSAWGLAVLPSRLVIVGGGAVAIMVVILGAALVLSRGLLLRLPLTRRWETQIADSRENLRRLLTVKVLIIGVALAVLAWLSEGLGLWFVLRGLDADLSLLRAVSVYATASLIGALVMLPGGVVGTEGSMVGLLRGMNLTRTDASAATIIIRLCTLWFAVVLGLAALSLFYWLVLRTGPMLAEPAVEAAALDITVEGDADAEKGHL